MNANKILDDLSCKLDSFNPAERKNALEEFKKAFVTAGESFVCEKNDNNMHCHTFFSFNGYGYSPTHVACWAKAERLFSAGLIDFDVLDGVDEFLAAARELDLRASCGVESRVVVKEMLDKVINSPGEPGIAYHLGVGFTTSGIPAEQRKYLDAMKAAANARTRGIVEKVNPALSPLELDFEKDVLTLTPGGNATERHVCMAYAEKAVKLFNTPVKLAGFWALKLGMTEEEALKLIQNSVKLQGVIRSKMMKSGGPGYVKPDPSSFPSLEAMNRFTIKSGAIPSIAWLNGDSDGEADPDALLDLHESYGAAMFNLIPDRNWNFGDPAVKAAKVANMDKIIASCLKRDMPVFCGTEMNAAGQKLVDTFAEPALARHLKTFVDGAAILNAHTILSKFGLGFLSDWSKGTFGGNKAVRNDFYIRFGRAAHPSITDKMTGIDTNAKLSDIEKFI